MAAVTPADWLAALGLIASVPAAVALVAVLPGTAFITAVVRRLRDEEDPS